MICRENAYFKNPEMKGSLLSSYFTSPCILPRSPQFLDLDRCLGDIHTMITGKIPPPTPPTLHSDPLPLLFVPLSHTHYPINTPKISLTKIHIPSLRHRPRNRNHPSPPRKSNRIRKSHPRSMRCMCRSRLFALLCRGVEGVWVYTTGDDGG